MAARTEEAWGEAAHKLHREVSTIGLLFVCLGSVIGSGWLFGALYASQIAGPAAIISWAWPAWRSPTTFIMVWKIAIPFLAVAVIMTLSFNASNFTSSAHGGFAPFGIQGILSAIATGGIIFCYQGFEQTIQFGGETRNPGRNIPFAVIGSMLVDLVLYNTLADRLPGRS